MFFCQLPEFFVNYACNRIDGTLKGASDYGIFHQRVRKQRLEQHLWKS